MNKTRPKQLSFRVSEEEYQQLQEKISESGKNQQEYILSCVLEKQIVNTDGIKELIPAVWIHVLPCSVPVAAQMDASHFPSRVVYMAVRRIP